MENEILSLDKNPGENILFITITNIRINRYKTEFGNLYINKLAKYVNRSGLDQLNNFYTKSFSDSFKIKEIFNSKVPVKFVNDQILLDALSNSRHFNDNSTLQVSLKIKDVLLKRFNSVNFIDDLKSLQNICSDIHLEHSDVTLFYYRLVIENNLYQNKYMVEFQDFIYKSKYSEEILSLIIKKIDSEKDTLAAEKLFFKFYYKHYDYYNYVINGDNYSLMLSTIVKIKNSYVYIDSLIAALYLMTSDYTPDLIKDNKIFLKKSVYNDLINKLNFDLNFNELLKSENTIIPSYKSSLSIKRSIDLLNSFDLYEKLNNSKHIQKK